jgi:hypothetical protein
MTLQLTWLLSHMGNTRLMSVPSRPITTGEKLLVVCVPFVTANFYTVSYVTVRGDEPAAYPTAKAMYFGSLIRILSMISENEDSQNF